MAVLPFVFLITPMLTIFSIPASASGPQVKAAVGMISLLLLIIPIVIPPVIAAYSVVGERDQGTLEPVLTAPLRASELLLGKAVAAFLPSVAIAYAIYLVVLISVRFGAAQVVEASSSTRRNCSPRSSSPRSSHSGRSGSASASPPARATSASPNNSPPSPASPSSPSPPSSPSRSSSPPSRSRSASHSLCSPPTSPRGASSPASSTANAWSPARRLSRRSASRRLASLVRRLPRLGFLVRGLRRLGQILSRGDIPGRVERADCGGGSGR